LASKLAAKRPLLETIFRYLLFVACFRKVDLRVQTGRPSAPNALTCPWLARASI
jgi:hypothetical protein